MGQHVTEYKQQILRFKPNVLHYKSYKQII